MTTVVSLVGFWAALSVIAFAAVVVRNALRRDRDGLTSDDAVTGIVFLIITPFFAGFVIAMTSGGSLTAAVNGHDDAGGSTNAIPQLAQLVVDSRLLSYAVAVVVLLWWYALLSALVAAVMRHRQQHLVNTVLPALGTHRCGVTPSNGIPTETRRFMEVSRGPETFPTTDRATPAPRGALPATETLDPAACHTLTA